jgi:predicted nucleotidyltransferase
MEHRNESFEPIGHALKRATHALRDAGVRHMVGGSVAVWARGGPESSHDLDLLLREEDVDAALAALEGAGMRTERPPEEWLVKAWDGDTLVDLIHLARELPITDEVLDRADPITVLGVTVDVMALEDVLATKLLALSEHALDYEAILQTARSLREQVPWDRLRERTAHSPYARAFFTLAEGLGIVQEHAPAQEAVTQ